MMIGGAVELADDRLEVLDDLRHRHGLDRRRVGVERLDLDLEARVGRGEHAVAGLLVVGDPVLPAAGRHPEAVDEDDGVGCGAHAGPPGVVGRPSRLTDTSSMPSSWIRSMTPCSWAWSRTGPVRTVWPSLRVTRMPSKSTPEVVADLAAKDELVRRARRVRRHRAAHSRRRVGELSAPPRDFT